MRTNEMGMGPVAASTPTRMPTAGAAVGTRFRIIHCGRSMGIIVTGSVTENVATKDTPDRGASA